MGRWTETEFDRVLLAKVRRLYDSCNRIENGVDARFRTFVKNLDPDDKAIQACFQSLVQKTQRSALPTRRRMYRNPSGDPRELVQYSWDPDVPAGDWGAAAQAEDSRPVVTNINFASHREPTPIPRSVIHDRQSPADSPASPDPLLLESLPFAHMSSVPLVRRRSRESTMPRSATQSPSGARRQNQLADGRTPASRQEDGSPPRSPSRAWLEEYSTHQLREPQAGPRDPFPFLFNLDAMPFNNEPSSSSRRRRIEDEVEETLRPWARRRLTHPVDEPVEPAQRPQSIPAARRGGRAARMQRDTRRDGIVFDELSPLAPSNISADGGLFGLDAQLLGQEEDDVHWAMDRSLSRDNDERPLPPWTELPRPHPSGYHPSSP